MLCWRMRRGSARLISARWCCAKVMRFVLSQCITRRLRSSKSRQRNPLLLPNSDKRHWSSYRDKAARPHCRRSGGPGYLDGAPGLVALADTAGARSLVVVPMLKDDGVVGNHRHFPPGGASRSPTSRSSWSRTSPPRPSSPSRTPACSMSCGNRWSSRRRLRRC